MHKVNTLKVNTLTVNTLKFNMIKVKTLRVNTLKVRACKKCRLVDNIGARLGSEAYFRSHKIKI